MKCCSPAYQSSTIRLSLSSASSAVVGTSATIVITSSSTLPIALGIIIVAESLAFAMSYRTQFSTRLARCSALELCRALLACLICTYPMKIALVTLRVSSRIRLKLVDFGAIPKCQFSSLLKLQQSTSTFAQKQVV